MHKAKLVLIGAYLMPLLLASGCCGGSSGDADSFKAALKEGFEEGLQEGMQKVEQGKQQQGDGLNRPKMPLVAYEVTLFTPENRPFTPADRKILDELQKKGFRVSPNPGGGGSNPDSNVKVGSGDLAVAKMVQTVVKGCYSQPLTISDQFEEGDTDIFVNLGADGDAKVICGN